MTRLHDLPTARAALRSLPPASGETLTWERFTAQLRAIFLPDNYEFQLLTSAHYHFSSYAGADFTQIILERNKIMALLPEEFLPTQTTRRNFLLEGFGGSALLRIAKDIPEFAMLDPDALTRRVQNLPQRTPRNQDGGPRHSNSDDISNRMSGNKRHRGSGSNSIPTQNRPSCYHCQGEHYARECPKKALGQ